MTKFWSDPDSNPLQDIRESMKYYEYKREPWIVDNDNYTIKFEVKDETKSNTDKTVWRKFNVMLKQLCYELTVTRNELTQTTVYSGWTKSKKLVDAIANSDSIYQVLVKLEYFPS